MNPEDSLNDSSGSSSDLLDKTQPMFKEDKMMHNEQTIFIKVFGLFGIIVAFVILCYVWKTLYFFVFRHCLRIQRWKSEEKMEYWLEVNDHIRHNTVPRICQYGKNNNNHPRGSFYEDGLNLDDFAYNRGHLPNGVQVQWEHVPTLITSPALSETYYKSSTNFYSPYNIDGYDFFNNPYSTPNKRSNISLSSSSSSSSTNPLLIHQNKKSPFNRRSAEEVWELNGEKKTPWLKRMIRKCLGEKDKVRWRKTNVFGYNNNNNNNNDDDDDNDESINKRAPHGFPFGGSHWIPKPMRRRSFYKYLRGNFITLVGSIGSVMLMIIGIALALDHAEIDLTNQLTTGAMLSLFALLKISDCLSPIVSYFNILWSDVVERGSIIEITPSISGLAYNSGNSLVGCVLDITPTYVYMLAIKPYITMRAMTGKEKFYDTINNKISTVSDFKTNNANTVSYTNGNSNSNNNSGNKNNVNHAEVAIIERDFFKIKMIVPIPTQMFYASLLSPEHVSWVPVMNLEPVAEVVK